MGGSEFWVEADGFTVLRFGRSNLLQLFVNESEQIVRNGRQGCKFRRFLCRQLGLGKFAALDERDRFLQGFFGRGIGSCRGDGFWLLGEGRTS